MSKKDQTKTQLFTQFLDLVNQNSLKKAIELFKTYQNKKYGTIDDLYEQILNSVTSKDYELAVRYLVVAYSVDEPGYKNDILFYLYLLNYLTEIPEEFKNKINKLKFEDVELSEKDKRYSSSSYMNTYRQKELEGEVFYLHQSRMFTIYDKLIFRIYKRRSNKINKTLPVVMTYIIIEEYQSVYDTISKEKAKRRISLGLEMIMQLAEIIVNIQKGIYPSVSTEIVEDEYTAVKIGNFNLAHQLRAKRKIGDSKVNTDGALRLLKIIIGLLNEKKPNMELKDCPPIENPDDLFTNFGNDYQIDQLKFQKYLEQIQKGEYNFLLAGMIKLYSIGKGVTEEVIRLTLFQIEKSQFKFNLDYYINVFHQAVANCEYMEAKIYLEIIKESANIGIDISKYLLVSLYEALPEDQIAPTTLTTEEPPATDSYYYGIPNIDKITENIIAGGLKVVSACKKMGLREEDINWIRLIYAKEYYCLGFYEAGDAFLKAVENSPYKTPEMTKTIKIIRTHKPLYINQIPGGKLGLKHIFIPNK